MLHILQTCGTQSLLPGEDDLRIAYSESVMSAGDRLDMGSHRLWTLYDGLLYYAKGHLDIVLCQLDFLPSSRDDAWATGQIERFPDRNLFLALDDGGNLIKWEEWNYPLNVVQGALLRGWDYEKRAIGPLKWRVDRATKYTQFSRGKLYSYITIAHCERISDFQSAGSIIPIPTRSHPQWAIANG
jgi:hypothetical protein